MQAFLREKLVDSLVRCGKLVDAFQAKEVSFLPDTLSWLKDLEDTLSRLRHSLAGAIASERKRVVASGEKANRPKGVSKSKYQVQEAAVALGIAEERLREVVVQIDSKFDGWREQIAQLAAIASQFEPIEISNPNLPESELRKIWQQMGKREEGRSMHQYLSASMPRSDLMYLLRDVVANLLANRTQS